MGTASESFSVVDEFHDFSPTVGSYQQVGRGRRAATASAGIRSPDVQGDGQAAADGGQPCENCIHAEGDSLG